MQIALKKVVTWNAECPILDVFRFPTLLFSQSKNLQWNLMSCAYLHTLMEPKLEFFQISTFGF